MSQFITANNKMAFIEKVKAALKQKYKAGEEVNLIEFSYQFGVREQNLRKAIDELAKEGFELMVPERKIDTSGGRR